MLEANDPTSVSLEKFKPTDLLDVLMGLKRVADCDPGQALQMLEANQDLAYAVLQAELLMGLIDELVISEQLEEFKQSAQPVAPAKPEKPDLNSLDPAQAAIIKQLIAMTEEQIAMLPQDQQEHARSLRGQYM